MYAVLVNLYGHMLLRMTFRMTLRDCSLHSEERTRMNAICCHGLIKLFRVCVQPRK